MFRFRFSTLHKIFRFSWCSCPQGSNLTSGILPLLLQIVRYCNNENWTETSPHLYKTKAIWGSIAITANDWKRGNLKSLLHYYLLQNQGISKTKEKMCKLTGTNTTLAILPSIKIWYALTYSRKKIPWWHRRVGSALDSVSVLARGMPLECHLRGRDVVFCLFSAKGLSIGAT
jgi:hypothetical protein